MTHNDIEIEYSKRVMQYEQWLEDYDIKPSVCEELCRLAHKLRQEQHARLKTHQSLGQAIGILELQSDLTKMDR
jgi:hypothetical protein